MKSMIIMYMVCLPMCLGIGTLARYAPLVKGEVLIRGNKNWGGGGGTEDS
jgi:hypothetical protein